MDTLATALRDIAQQAGFTPEDVAIARGPAAPSSRSSSGSSTAILPFDGKDAVQCAVCRDARFVRRDVPVGHPDFGKPFPCRCTREDPAVREARRRERIGYSGLSPDLQRCTFDTLRPSRALADALAAVRAAVQVQYTGGDPLWVALFGPPGVGKTHLLAAAANALLPRQKVTYWTLPQMLAACKAKAWVNGKYEAFAEEQTVIATASSTDVLLLDEVGGPDLEHEYGWGKLDLIIKRRYERRAPLLLAFTCDLAHLGAVAPAVASRLRDRSLVRVVVIDGPDYRAQLAREADDAR